MPEINKMDLGVLGFSGLKQYGGVIDEEWHPKLRGDFGPKVYREMSDNSSVIGAVLYIIRALVRQVEFRIEPASPEQEAIDVADFVDGCLYDMSHTFEDFISEALSMLPYGWSYFEEIYKIRRGEVEDPTGRSAYDDGKIGWRKFALRAQDTLDRWEFDEEGGLQGMHQADTTSGRTAFIPIGKAVLFRTESTKGNPQGRSILRNAVVDYWYLKRISEIEAIGIERDMTGVIKMEVPFEMLSTDASPKARAVRATIEKMLAELKRDEREYVMVPAEIDQNGKPTGYKLSLLTTGGARQINTNETKLYYKIGILQSVVAQFIQLGMAGVGSFALASTQTNLFSVALGTILDTLTSVFNRFAISRLMELNGIPRDLWPELVHGDLEAPPLGEIGSYLQSLANSGLLPDDEAIQRKVLEFANLPQPEQEEGETVEKKRTGGGLVKREDTRQIPGPPVRGVVPLPVK
ncbi:MAG: hypothetical protein GWM98_04790 [Nitrospinaceae bacterium]|nr:hypothetical protein [Deltaproteobacteria bacterium]NIY14237.1 hypothetical protein [Nitrospinaceae bacterium]